MNALKTISKTEDELRVANYIVLFGGRDLEGLASTKVNQDGSKGEYFSTDTELESSYTKTGRLLVDFEHGLGRELDGDDAPGRDDVLGYVDWKTLRVDEKGAWVERVLNRRNEYMQFLETLIEEELMGNSSEAVEESVKKAADGHIEAWPLRRDTLTVNPMEPRMLTENAMQALKALELPVPDQEVANGKDRETVEPPTTEKPGDSPITDDNNKGVSKMSTIEIPLDKYEDLVRGQAPVEEPDPEPELADNPVIKHMQGQLNDVLDLLQNSPKAKDAGIVSPDSESDHAERKTFGDFLVSVRLGNKKRLRDVYKSTYQKGEYDGIEEHQKAALAEGSGTTGGYLVPTEFGGPITLQADQQVILRQAGAPVEQMTARTKELWLLDVETAPSAGSTAFAGGVVGYWISEAGSITESEPQFRLVELVAHKLAAYSLASSEVRDDAAATIDGLLGQAFAAELAAQENYAHFRGDGVGKPLGILNSSAWNAGTRSAASTIALADLATIEGNFLGDVNEGVYVINTAAFKELVELVSNPLAFLNSMREQIPMTLLGRPLYRYGGLPALDTAGDIMLVNPNYYILGERSGLSIAFSEHFKFQNDQLAWRVIRRIDGQPAIDDGVTLENASTKVYPFSGLAAG